MTMLKIEFTNRMKRDAKLMQRRGKDMSKLAAILQLLAAGRPLPIHCRDHQLKGELKEYRECHIENDWLLLYKIIEDRLILLAFATGRHSDLFNE